MLDEASPICGRANPGAEQAKHFARRLSQCLPGHARLAIARPDCRKVPGDVGEWLKPAVC